MDNIFSIYIKTMKKDIILFMAIFVILILTGFFWLGFPLYFFINTLPLATPILFPLVSALLFSLGFIYTNINVAKQIHQTQSNRSIFQWTLYFQLLIIGIAFFLIFIGYMSVIYWS
jgi:hypothetical protein